MAAYAPGLGDLPSPFGPYEVVRKLGKGGMGSVFLVRDSRLERQAALKVSRFSEHDRPDLVQRFYQEGRMAAKLAHPNLCPVYEVGNVDGVHYLTMPYLEGKNLAELIKEEKAFVGQPRATAALVEKLARALAFLHARGVVHRDLKPVNIMMVGQDELQPVIVDFGLALQLDAADEKRLSQPGQILGTVLYMAPEQHAGDLAMCGPACNVYSLGVILYELLTGAVPFNAPSIQQVWDRKLRGISTPCRGVSGRRRRARCHLPPCTRAEACGALAVQGVCPGTVGVPAGAGSQRACDPRRQRRRRRSTS